MKNKLLTLLGFYCFMMIVSVVSCDKCGPFPDKFKVIEMNWNVGMGEHNAIPSNHVIFSPIDSDSILYNKYAIKIDPVTTDFFSAVISKPSFSFINSSYACSPIEPSTDERIDSIVIVCNKNFDVSHPMGTSLSELFNIVVYDEISIITDDLYMLNDYIGTHPAIPNIMTLILNSPPSTTESFIFTVKYYQDGIDHDYFEFTSEEVIIKSQ